MQFEMPGVASSQRILKELCKIKCEFKGVEYENCRLFIRHRRHYTYNIKASLKEYKDQNKY